MLAVSQPERFTPRIPFAISGVPTQVTNTCWSGHSLQVEIFAGLEETGTEGVNSHRRNSVVSIIARVG